MNNGKLEVRTNCIPFGNVTKMENLQSKDIIKITGKEQYNLPFFFFCFFRAAHVAYEDSQARGPFGAPAARLCHSNSNLGSERHMPVYLILIKNSFFQILTLQDILYHSILSICMIREGFHFGKIQDHC